MGARGPRPTPTHLKLLRGNPGKQAINKTEPQPRPDAAVPAAPAMLTGFAREEWDRIAPELFHLRLLTRVDRQPLAAYCQAYAIWRTAVEAFNATSEHFYEMNRLVVRHDNGNATQNPLLAIIRNASSEMVRYAAEFGFTPAARSRITAAAEGKTQASKFDGLLVG
jgi:P27 family predicted phage terminase small subunit